MRDELALARISFFILFPFLIPLSASPVARGLSLDYSPFHCSIVKSAAECAALKEYAG